MTSVRPWVQLSSGKAFDLLEPTVEQARAALPDLLLAICKINRFNGHTPGGVWSVGAHSLLVAELLEGWGAPPTIVREGLLHDIGEAIYGDVTSPVASAMRAICGDAPVDPFRALRVRVDLALAEAFGIPAEARPLVKRADLVALALERRDLMAACERDWYLPEYAPAAPRVQFERYGWGPSDVHGTLVKRLAELDASIPRPIEAAVTP